MKSHGFFTFYLGGIADKSAICRGITMKKLVLQEIWADFRPSKIKKPYNYIIAIMLILICIVLLSTISVYENIYIIIAFIAFSNSMLESNISDCIYAIPINVSEYIKAKYKVTVAMELLIYAAIEALRYIICILSDEKLSYALVLEHIFITAALVVYVIIKNTWLLYINFGLKEIQTWKMAQGLSLVWFFGVEIIADIAEEKIMDPVTFLLELLAVLSFAAYGVYIYVYVKKNLMIKTFK